MVGGSDLTLCGGIVRGRNIPELRLLAPHHLTMGTDTGREEVGLRGGLA